jgi:hypothetical protein
MLEIKTSLTDNPADIEQFAGEYTFFNKVGNAYTFINDHEQLTIESDDKRLENLVVGKKYMLRK